VLIVVVQTCVRAFYGKDGFFSLDDFVFYTRAAGSELVDPSFLFEPYNGHLMPGSFAWVWISTAFAPLDFSVTLATMLVLQVLVSVAVLGVLVYMFGLRPAILVPFAVHCLTVFTLPSSLWWAAAVNQQPQQLAAALFLLAHLVYLRTGHRRWIAAACAALVVGLAFFEKTALIVPFAGVLTWAFFTPREGTKHGLRLALRRYCAAWISYLVVLLPYTVLYLAKARQDDRGWPESSSFLELFDFSIRKAVLPAVVGGPWQWAPTGVVDNNADPAFALQVVAVVIVAAVVWASMQVNRSAARSWGICAGYFVGLVLVLTVTRGAVIGTDVIGTEYRYLSDFALVLAVCGGLAFLPARFGPWWAPADEKERRTTPRLLTGRLPALVATVAVLAVVVNSTISTASFAERWTANPARVWVENAEKAVPELSAQDRYYDGVVPTAVVWQLLYPANLPSRILGPVGLRAKPLAPGEYRDVLWHFAADGRLETANVTGVTTRRMDEPDCLIRIDDKPRELELESTVFDWPWILQLEYRTERDGHLRIEAGDTRITADVFRVLQNDATILPTIYTPVNGGYDSVTLSADTEICLKTIKIGAPQPNEW